MVNDRDDEIEEMERESLQRRQKKPIHYRPAS